MSDEVEEEVRRLISISFHGLPDSGVQSATLTRVWSLDFQWTDSMDAHRLLESLVQSGWLCLDGDLVRPVENFSNVSIPIGWTPMLRRMLDGVDYTPSNQSNDENSNINHSEKISIDESTIDDIELESNVNPTIDPMIQKIQEIRSHIAKASGLEIREIQRRAQRKRNSCMPMTLWMALLLVGREQRIDISSFL